MINTTASAKSQFLFPAIMIFVITDVSFALTRYEEPNYYRQQYRDSYAIRRSQPDPFCNATNQIKTAICNAIFNDESFKLDHLIYLNKSAIFQSEMSCEENEVVVEIVDHDDSRLQHMFPCYGRHHPPQSRWDIDDYYRYVFLSGNPQNNTVFVYYLERTPDEDIYFLKEIIGEFNLDIITPMEIIQADVAAEEAMLQYVSISYSIRKIETNFIRRIIYDRFTPQNSICDLSRSQKLQLCRYVVTWTMHEFSLIEHLFGSLSLACYPKKIEFIRFMEENDSEEDHRRTARMFPCYGNFIGRTHITVLELSDGHYENVIFTYIEASSQNLDYTYSLRSAIHNLNIRGIPEVSIPPRPH